MPKTFLTPKQSREKDLRAIFDEASDGVLLADVKTKKLYLGNKKVCKMLGYRPEEIKTLGVIDIHPKIDLPYVLDQFAKQVRGQISLSENMPMKRKDGSVFYADVNASSVKLGGKTYLMGIFREKAKRTKTERKLIEQKIRDDAVLQSIGDGLIVIVDVDKGGRIAYVNKVFEDITGWSSREIVNKSIVKVLPREDKSGKAVSFKDRVITKVLAGEKVIADLSSPFYYIRKDKSKFPVASVITPVVFNNRIIGAVETFRDISKEIETDKAKTEFASLVSHQLRTPFATINWYVELLLAQDVGSLNEKQTQYLQEVYKASKRMVSLINVLLSISRIEMGIIRMEEKSVDIIALAKTIVNEEQLGVKDKHLEVKETYGKNIPKILADSKQMTIIFQNLFTNAIKYSALGGKINLKVERKGANILITVSDSGMGIPKDAQLKIFTRFFRADNAKAQEPEGVGLGLYILKAVVDLMNGKVWFKSQEGKGTTFYVMLPIKEA